MSKIDDVVVFALKNPDYFGEFLSGGEPPPELTDDEQGSLSDARDHVEEVLCGLLHAVGEKIPASCGCKSKRFYPATTKQNRSVSLSPTEDRSRFVANVSVAFEQSTTRMDLVVRIRLKKPASTHFESELKSRRILFGRARLVFTFRAPAIEDGDTFDDIALRVDECIKRVDNALAAAIAAANEIGDVPDQTQD